MRDPEEVATKLSESLSLERPPVALAFVTECPAGIERFGAEVPSACTFWKRAEDAVFYASAEQHLNCPIGAMTMAFELREDVQQNLMRLVELMGAEQYLEMDEPPAIPNVGSGHTGIVYGPLDGFPLEPDVILMWLSPAQAMVYNEAAGSAHWADPMGANVFGRPTCAAVGVSVGETRPTMSLGCVGMRTFTGMPADRMLASVPAAAVESFLAALATTVSANQSMQTFYEQHKLAFSG
jgi:uncharacterized protein (DUF169 family)